MIWTIFRFEYPERATIPNEPNTTQKTTQKTIQKTTQKGVQSLTEQQQAILSFLKEHPEATRKRDKRESFQLKFLVLYFTGS